MSMCRNFLLENRNEIISKIDFCMAQSREGLADYSYSEEFPLTEILYEIYRIAIFDMTIEHKDRLTLLLEKYKKDHKDFKYDSDNLMRKGWAETYFCQRDVIEHRRVKNKDEFLKKIKPTDDYDIIEFVLWTDTAGHLANELILDKDVVYNLLEKWKNACNRVPDFEWFENQGYFSYDESGVYLTPAEHSKSVEQAMGRIWNDICRTNNVEELFQKWEYLALQLHLSSDVILYIKNECDSDFCGVLLKRILLHIRKESEYADEEMETRRYFNIIGFETDIFPEHSSKKVMEEYTSAYRPFRDKHLNSYSSEYYAMMYKRRWSTSFYLCAVLRHFELVRDEFEKDFYDLIKRYYVSGRLSDDIYILPENVLEFLLHEETFYFGFKLLTYKIFWYKRQIREYSGYICEILDAVLKYYIKQGGFPGLTDLLDAELYLMDLNKTSRLSDTDDNPYFILYKRILKLYFCVDYRIYLQEGLSAYFKSLMEKNLSDVDYGRCFTVLANCTDCVLDIYRNEDSDIASKLIKEIYLAIRKVLFEDCKYARFVDSNCLSKNICGRVFSEHIADISTREKVKIFGMQCKLSDKFEKACVFKICIQLTTSAYLSLKSEETADMLMVMIENSFTSEESFGYFDVVLYNLEGLITETLVCIEEAQNLNRSFYGKLLVLDVPELVMFLGMIHIDDVDKCFRAEIEKRVESVKDSNSLLPRIYDERFIDIVINKKIESLYTAVEERLEKKIKKYKGNNQTGIKNDRYLIAERQKTALLYIQGKKVGNDQQKDTSMIAEIVTKNIETFEGYKAAYTIWWSLIDSDIHHTKQYRLNYNCMYAIYKYLDRCELSDANNDYKKILKENFDRIYEHIISCTIDDWKASEQLDILILIFTVYKMLGYQVLELFTDLYKRVSLKPDMSEICLMVLDIDKRIAKSDTEDNKDDKILSIKEEESLVSTRSDILNGLREINAYTLEDKASLFAAYKGKELDDKKNIRGTLLFKTLIRVCWLLSETIPFLVPALGDFDKPSNNMLKNEKTMVHIPEDNISILFRECFNMAYNELFGMFVGDQQKRSTTGKWLKKTGFLSPAEVDMCIHYDESTYEFFEAFVLEKYTKKSVYRDHFKKLLANAALGYADPLFMIVYSTMDNGLEHSCNS